METFGSARQLDQSLRSVVRVSLSRQRSTGEVKRATPIERRQIRLDVFSGDIGFQALASWYGWAKEPIVQTNQSRIENISEEISIFFIYGSRTNIDNVAAQQILRQRGTQNTSLKVTSSKLDAEQSFRFAPRSFTTVRISSSWKNRYSFTR